MTKKRLGKIVADGLREFADELGPQNQPDQESLSEHDLIQLKQASRGRIDGKLSDWTHLQVALKKAGRNLPLDTRARELQLISKKILEERKE